MSLVIGKNPEWKQEISIGARNNQNFVQVPHARFIHMLSYKAELVGMNVVLQVRAHAAHAASSTMSWSVSWKALWVEYTLPRVFCR